jgi:hypothetical protein
MTGKPMPKTRKSLRDGGELLLIGIVFVIVFAVFRAAPEFEGDIAPVTTPARLSKPPIPDGPMSTVLSLEAVKLRGQCKWRDVVCYMGRRDGDNVSVPCRFLDQPTIRPAGALKWEGLKIDVPPAFWPQTYADVFHRCHPLWRTRSKFWTGSAAQNSGNDAQ